VFTVASIATQAIPVGTSTTTTAIVDGNKMTARRAAAKTPARQPDEGVGRQPGAPSREQKGAGDGADAQRPEQQPIAVGAEPQAAARH
jgi:hypothetical protein